jgi:hypothetical protein
MNFRIGWPILLLLCATAPQLGARDDLNQDQLALLQDSGGWEFIKISIPEGGLQAEHTCFDGKPHPDECSGKLNLAGDGTFVQTVSIGHQDVSRHGTYQLDGDQLTFFDEAGTADGPFKVSLDMDKKTLVLKTTAVRMELQSEKEYRKKKPDPDSSKG